MGQRSNDAAVMDVRTKPRKEECAHGTGRRSNYAVVRDVRALLLEEECASGMGQRSNLANYATMKDVRTVPREEECAYGTGHIAYEEFVALVYVLRVNSGVLFITFFRNLLASLS